MSCYEIHVETVRDLLNPDNQQVQLMTNASAWKPIEIEVKEGADVNMLLADAQKNRSVARTLLNEHSSRSHCIFQLKIWDAAGAESGALNLIDLAGSERIHESGATGERRQEALAINKHLSTLGDCISAISSEASHVPFRNSKLTFLLQNYLKGEAKVLMIVNVSPLQDHANESLTSLKFAKKVNECRVNKKEAAAEPFPEVFEIK